MLQRKSRVNSMVLFDTGILLMLAWITHRHVPLSLVFSDTLATGGDLPAHHYLVTQLKQNLLENHRIVGWAPGMWCGFPLFQFYFPLPYLLIALLDLVLPYTIAFKVVYVLGIYAMPVSAYTAARWLSLARPAPVVIAIFSMLHLFTAQHTMWGANAYSTLAGMIANAISFPLMLLTVGSWFRDTAESRGSVRSVILFVLLVLSHFFTALFACLAIAMIPVVRGRRNLARSIRSLADNALPSALLVAWWVVPLLSKRPYSVDFGTNWPVSLWASLPVFCAALVPFVVIAWVSGLRRSCAATLLMTGMTAAGAILFTWGFDWSPVFVNVRLWPFVFFGILWLGATGLADAVRGRRGVPLALLAVLSATWLHITSEQQPYRVRHTASGTAAGSVRSWSEFNLKGIEARPGYEAFRQLILPLDGTPGRLAGDLSHANNAMGSSRILECVPHLINKPILEGGLVNSALGAYYAYYLQCEASETCAGAPPLVEPAQFDPARATAHMELFNVRHFLARESSVKAAMHASDAWKLVRSHGPWSLFELQTHGGELVTIPAHEPFIVSDASEPDRLGLEWLYCFEMLDTPAVFLPPNTPRSAPAADRSASRMDMYEFRRLLSSFEAADGTIREWLHAGPFPFRSEGLPEPEALPFRPGPGFFPEEHGRLLNQTWKAVHTRGNLYPGRYHARPADYVSYSAANIYAPEQCRVRLHYSCDDGIVIWLNGQALVTAGITGTDTFRTVDMTLSKGRNTLVVCAEQKEGGHYFSVRITDRENRICPDLTVSFRLDRPMPAEYRPVPLDTGGRSVVFQELDRSGHRLRFTTEAVGYPHLIKISWYPNWKARKGASSVYRVSPAFMLVYPESAEVELVYGYTGADVLGMLLSAAGVLLLAGRAAGRRNAATRSGQSE